MPMRFPSGSCHTMAPTRCHLDIKPTHLYVYMMLSSSVFFPRTARFARMFYTYVGFKTYLEIQSPSSSRRIAHIEDSVISLLFVITLYFTSDLVLFIYLNDMRRTNKMCCKTYTQTALFGSLNFGGKAAVCNSIAIAATF